MRDIFSDTMLYIPQDHGPRYRVMVKGLQKTRPSPRDTWVFSKNEGNLNIGNKNTIS